MMMSEIKVKVCKYEDSSHGLTLESARANYLDKELFLNHKQFSVAELLTHFENLN